MKSRIVFSKDSDEWETPDDLFDSLHEEFNFGLDAAATAGNCKVPCFISPDEDALSVDWTNHQGKRVPVWLNPPYSGCRPFIQKAYAESRAGSVVVCLVPSRTDVRWFHDFVWSTPHHRPYGGVEIRFIRGRVKFKPAQGTVSAGAPFPSMLVIFRPICH